MNYLYQFEPNWESLAHYRVPDWFRDAKFGIFLHWGVHSVPANDGWYARLMYIQEGAPWGNAYEYHLQHYGHPSRFGFKDLIPLWKAEHWEPDALALFFKRIGAKYLVPVASYHDNIDNFSSTWQAWNSVNLGPHRDVMGEWKQAAEKYGLRIGASSHSDRTWDWFSTAHGSDSQGALAGVPYDGNLRKSDGLGQWWEGYDPQELYARPHAPEDEPDEEYCERYYRRMLELIDQYQLDLLYFDGPLPMVCPSLGGEQARSRMARYGLELAAHFYNASQLWHNGNLEAVLNIKSWGPGTVPDETAIVLDIEKGQRDSLCPFPWQTDTSLTKAWFYTPEILELSGPVVIHNLCDIVSKNGNLLLNVGLKADGTLPEEQQQVLEMIGRWLEVNGEAIYGTRPWRIYGEGPTQVQSGHFLQNLQPYTAQDIRFTTKGETLYAILLGWPAERVVTIHSIQVDTDLWFGKIGPVELVGSDLPVTWKFTEHGLTVRLPEQRPCEHAFVLRLRAAE